MLLIRFLSRKSAGRAALIKACLRGAGVFCACVFLAVRLRGFLAAARHILMPMPAVWAAAAALSLPVILYAGRRRFTINPYIRMGMPAAYAVTALSVVFCAAFRAVIIDRPLTGAGIRAGGAAYILSVLGAGLLLAAFLLISARTAARGFHKARSIISSLNAGDIVSLGALLAVMNLCAYLYVHASRTIYFGDAAGYWTTSRALADAAGEGPVFLMKTVYNSILTQDYNNLIALPWVPLVLLLGRSRWVFVAGIVNLGLFPVYLLLYFFIKARCRRPAAVAAGVFCMFPMLFYTAVTGFIDTAVLVCALGALLLWLPLSRAAAPKAAERYTGRKNKTDICRYFAAGCLLALAILLRRWYAFFAASFFAAAAADSIIFRKSAAPLAAAAASFSFTLLFLFQPFVTGVLLKNYASMYRAFSFDIGVDVRYFFFYFGFFVVCILAYGGAYLLYRKDTRRAAFFLLVQPFGCFLLFVSVQSHGQQHLLLYVPALALSASLSLAALTNRLSLRRTRAAAAALYAALAFCAVPPFVQPLLLKTKPAAATDIRSIAFLPSFIYVPPVRGDTDMIIALVWYLDRTAGSQGKTVGVLASSLMLNIDILVNAEDSLSLRETSGIDRRYLVWLPEIDGRDKYPGRLFDCDYLLVADPVQASLGPEKQRCIALPVSQLLNKTGIGRAYRPVGYVFNIGGGSVRVRLYEKARDVTGDEQAALLDAYYR